MPISISAAYQCCPFFQTYWQISHHFATEKSYSVVLNSTLGNIIAQDRTLGWLLALFVSVHHSNVISLIPKISSFLSAVRMMEIILYCVLYEVEFCKVSNNYSNHMVKWFAGFCLKNGISSLVRSLLDISLPKWKGVLSRILLGAVLSDVLVYIFIMV